jgi:hypothetical protein
MSTRDELTRRLHELERELGELRGKSTPSTPTTGINTIRNAFSLMKAFHDAPSHRLSADATMRAAGVVGFTPEDLDQLQVGPDPALHKDNDGYALTLRGSEWYQRCFSVLMSRTE